MIDTEHWTLSYIIGTRNSLAAKAAGTPSSIPRNQLNARSQGLVLRQIDTASVFINLIPFIDLLRTVQVAESKHSETGHWKRAQRFPQFTSHEYYTPKTILFQAHFGTLNVFCKLCRFLCQHYYVNSRNYKDAFLYHFQLLGNILRLRISNHTKYWFCRKSCAVNW